MGADKSNEMDFKQFAEFMDLLEASMDGEDDEDDEEDAPPAAGKGFGAKPAAPAKAAAAAPAKGARGDGSDSEVMEITKELFDDLRGKRKTLSVDALKVPSRPLVAPDTVARLIRLYTLTVVLFPPLDVGRRGTRCVR